MNATDTSSRTATAGAPILGERGELFAAVTFLEGTLGGWGAWDLTGWFDDYLVSAGRMARPALVREADVGIIALDPRGPFVSRATMPATELPRLVGAARERVVATLRRFIGQPVDDRFVNAALFAGRVMRDGGPRDTTWVARPVETDRLSDIVLSLFVADILMHREFHEASLCVCDVCGRVSFAPEIVSRSGCREHPPPSVANSGFYHRGAARDGRDGVDGEDEKDESGLGDR